PTGKSLTPGCATSLNACQRRAASRITKRCCRGTAHQLLPLLPENKPVRQGGVYGALTKRSIPAGGATSGLGLKTSIRFSKRRNSKGKSALESERDSRLAPLDATSPAAFPHYTLSLLRLSIRVKAPTISSRALLS